VKCVKIVFLRVDVRTMTYTVLKKQRRLEIMTTSEFDLIRKNRAGKRTSIYSRDYLLKALEMLCKDKGVSKGKVFNKALEDFLRKHRYLDANGRIIYG
jgi:hypothetical protein